MTLPGSEVDLVDSPPSITELTDSGVLFAIGKALTAVPLEEIYDLAGFVAAAGDRQSGSPLYDAIDSYFHHGGAKAFISTAGMSATSSDIVALLDNFDHGLGIGQVAAPGLDTSVIQLAVMAMVLDTKRVAVLDGTDTAVVATLTAQAAALTDQPGDKFSALFAPWDVIPGLATGTTRVVPASGRIAGNIALNDARGLSTNDPAAGPNGIARWATDVSQHFTDSDQTTLNPQGVNLTRLIRKVPRTMGWRSLANQSANANWSMFSNSRLLMETQWELDLMNENFEFAKIDGRNHTLKKYQGAIKGVLLPFFEDDDLYGDTPADAFTIDVGPSVNTPETEAEGLLKARIALRTSPFGERVIIEIAKVPITESLPAGS